MKVFIDTNSYFAFFGVDSDNSSLVEFKRLLGDKGSKIELVVTQQLRDEYERGIGSQIDKSRQSLKSAEPKYTTTFPDEIKDIGEKVKTEAEAVVAKIKKLKEEKVAAFEKQSAETEKLVVEIFALGHDVPCTPEIIEKAKDRYVRGNPPRKRDSGDKDASYGDAIIWESLLAGVDDDIAIVTHDADYTEKKDGAKIVNRFLKNEWEKKGKKISLHSHLGTFVNTLEKKPVITKEAIQKEIKNSDLVSTKDGLGFRVVTTERVFPITASGLHMVDLDSASLFEMNDRMITGNHKLFLADSALALDGVDYFDTKAFADLNTVAFPNVGDFGVRTTLYDTAKDGMFALDANAGQLFTHGKEDSSILSFSPKDSMFKPLQVHTTQTRIIPPAPVKATPVTQAPATEKKPEEN